MTKSSISDIKVIPDGGNGEERWNNRRRAEQLRQVRRIRVAARAWEARESVPLARSAMTWAAVSGLLAIAALNVAKPWLPVGQSLALSMLVLAIASIGTFVLVLKRGKAAQTHEEHLDRLLCSYRPVSKDAFLELQAKVREQWALDVGLIWKWIEAEGRAISVPSLWRKRSELRFLEKKV